MYDVSPVQISQLFRCFYDQKILQKTFIEWKEQWTVCREKKLSLNADNHYRLVKWLPIGACMRDFLKEFLIAVSHPSYIWAKSSVFIAYFYILLNVVSCIF